MNSSETSCESQNDEESYAPSARLVWERPHLQRLGAAWSEFNIVGTPEANYLS